MNGRLRIYWLAFVLAGCAAAPENHYYRLAPIATDGAAAAFPELSDTALTVALPALLDRMEIVEGTGPHTVAIREFDRWVAPLDEMVPQVLGEDLAVAEANRHGAFDPRVDDGRADARHFAVHIDDFMAGTDGIVRLDGTWSVRADLGTRSGRRTWRFTLRALADPQLVSTVAASMSRLLEQLAATIASTS